MSHKRSRYFLYTIAPSDESDGDTIRLTQKDGEWMDQIRRCKGLFIVELLETADISAPLTAKDIYALIKKGKAKAFTVKTPEDSTTHNQNHAKKLHKSGVLKRITWDGM